MAIQGHAVLKHGTRPVCHLAVQLTFRPRYRAARIGRDEPGSCLFQSGSRRAVRWRHATALTVTGSGWAVPSVGNGGTLFAPTLKITPTPGDHARRQADRVAGRRSSQSTAEPLTWRDRSSATRPANAGTARALNQREYRMRCTDRSSNVLREGRLANCSSWHPDARR